ncbi:MAG: nucleotidyltransferase domain-containing protein [Thermoanaerobaculia bacterium]|nr:nucleotidyltransferase domain-containing protein [Thermoanaerobaculia bacterium]
MRPDDPLARSLCSSLRATVDELVAAYLFGSTADDTTHPESDLDLAVLTELPLSAEARWELEQRVSRELRRTVDLVDLRQAPTTLQSRIVASGTRLCCFDETKAEEFENFVFVAYADLNLERREILQQVETEGHVLAR